MTPIQQPEYGPDLIRPVRPPEVEGEEGKWRSRWQLRVRDRVAPEDLDRAEQSVREASGVSVHLAVIEGGEVRLEMTTGAHPLDVEGWPTVDRVLLAVDEEIGLLEVNHCPRDWWRPFRE